MNRALFPVLACVGLSFLAVAAHAQFINFQVNNFTLSGGDPVYSITDDVTFQNLLLTEKFADNTTAVVSLFDPADPTHTSTDTLDTGVLNLESDTIALVNPGHGALTSATLTGTFDTTNLTLQTAFGGALSSVTVNPNFTATLSNFALNSFVNINAVDSSSGAVYAAGTLGAAPLTPNAVPEPGICAFLAACGTGLTVFVRRRRAKRG